MKTFTSFYHIKAIVRLASVVCMLFVGAGNAWGADYSKNESWDFSTSGNTNWSSTNCVSYCGGWGKNKDASPSVYKSNIQNFKDVDFSLYENVSLTIYVKAGTNSGTNSYTVKLLDKDGNVISGAAYSKTKTDGMGSGSNASSARESSLTFTPTQAFAGYRIEFYPKSFITQTRYVLTYDDKGGAPTPTHTLGYEVSPAASGTVVLSATTVAEGGTATATATPNSGYRFSSWAISGTGASLSSTSTNPTTVTMGTANATVTANFESKGCTDHYGDNVESSTATSNKYGAVATYYKYSTRQILYTRTDLNLAVGKKGTIKSIYFNAATNITARDITIYMANTSLSALSTSNYVPYGDFTQVFSSDSWACSSGWNEIELSTPFEYNGGDNLVVLIDDNSNFYKTSETFSCHTASTTSGAQIWKGDDYTNEDPSSTTWSSYEAINTRPSTKFCIQEVDMVPCTVAPTVSAGSYSDVTSTTATISCAGVSSLGTGDCGVSSYGFVVGPNTNPELSGEGVVQYEIGTSSPKLNIAFSQNLTSLTPNTTYYVRPYATNGFGTSYGTQATFTTLQRYTISYNNNGGTGSIASAYKDHGDDFTLSNGSGMSKTGYTLTNWLLGSASGDEYALSGTYSANGDATFYAQWTANSYSVKFNANGGSGSISDQDFTYGVAQTLSKCTLTPPLHKYFTGWNTKTNGSGISYSDQESVSDLVSEVDGSITLYAQWADHTYTNYRTRCCTDPATALSITNADGVAMGNTLTLATAGGNGMTVTWSVEDGTGSATIEGTTLTPTSDGTVTIKAHQDINTSTNKCEQDAEMTVTIVSSIINVASVSVDPTSKAIIPGESFTITPTVLPADATDKTVSWTSSASGTASVSSLGIVTGVAAGTATITCTTTDGGKTATTTVTVYGVTMQATDEDGNTIAVGGPGAPSRTGIDIIPDDDAANYVFKEWQISGAELGDEADVKENTITNPTGAVTVTAVYYKPRIVKWCVNGNDAYNEGEPTTAVAYGGTIENTPDAPSGLGCASSFVAWTDASHNNGAAAKDDDSYYESALYSEAGDFPSITAETTTFYAVFAEQLGADVNTVVWSEDFSSYSANNVPNGSVTTTEGRQVYNNGNVFYSCTNGTGSSFGTTKIANDYFAGGSSPEIMVGKKGSGGSAVGGSFVISGIPSVGAKKLTLTYKQNGNKLLSQATGTGYSGGLIDDTAQEQEVTITCGTAPTFTITFQATTTSNVRLDDIVIKVKTTNYHNYVTECITVTYNANGGATSCTNDATITTEDYTVCATEPTRDYYTFAGWLCSADADTYDAGATIDKAVIDDDFTLTAQWTPTNYSITYNLNGGTQQETPAPATSYTIESSTITLPTPSYGHKRFDGWFDNENLEGDPKTNIAAGSSGDVELWAKWSERYTVQFYAEDELTTIYRAADEKLNASVAGQGSAPADPSAPALCSSKTFVGWSESAITLETDVAPGDLRTTDSNVSADKTFYAVWATDNGDKTYSAYSTYCYNAFVPGGGTGKGNWSEAGNWSSGSAPDENTRVVIDNKEMTVDVTDAKAKEIVVKNEGKLIVAPGKAIIVAGKITKDNGAPTTAADLKVESSAAGNGTLIFENDGNAATVEMYSIGSTDGWKWQYIGVPFDGANAQATYYGAYLYKWNNGWTAVQKSDDLEMFAGYCISYPAANYTYVMDGALAPTTSKSVSVPAGKSMVVGNSWTAPIQITQLEDEDFSGLLKNVYLYNTGNDEAGKATTTSEPTGNAIYAAGTYISVPIHSASYFDVKVISSLQGFFVKDDHNAEGGGTLNLSYSKHVRPSGGNSVVNGAMHAPKRVADETDRPAVLKMKVSGSRYDDRLILLEREDFTTGYDAGWDGDKMGDVATSPRITTTREDGTADAVAALPDLEGTLINFRAASTDDQYTLYFDYETEDAEPLYLLDLTNNAYTRVETGSSYTFFTTDKADHKRFALTRYRAPQITTGVEDALEDNGQGKAVKFIKNDKLYILRNGVLYDGTGKKVIEN